MTSDASTSQKESLLELPKAEFGFSAADPLLSNEALLKSILGEEYTRDEEVSIPGMMDIVHKVSRYPELLPIYIRGGFFSLDKVLNFLNESGSGLDIIGDQISQRDSYPFMFGPDWLVRFVNYFMGFTQVSSETEQTWIPVAEVHCPNIENCSTDFACSTTRFNQHSFKITALGFSGGSGYSKKIKLSSGATATQNSLQLQVKAEVRLRIYQNDLGDRVLALDVTRIFDETRYVTIDASNFYRIPIQSIANDENLKSVSFDTEVDKPFEILEIEIGKKHNFSWATNIPGLLEGATAALSVESQLLCSASYKYNFTPGYRYIFYPIQIDSHVYCVFFESKE